MESLMLNATYSNCSFKEEIDPKTDLYLLKNNNNNNKKKTGEFSLSQLNEEVPSAIILTKKVT
jgi:hypothetical protein